MPAAGSRPQAPALTLRRRAMGQETVHRKDTEKIVLFSLLSGLVMFYFLFAGGGGAGEEGENSQLLLPMSLPNGP